MNGMKYIHAFVFEDIFVIVRHLAMLSDWDGVMS